MLGEIVLNGTFGRRHIVGSLTGVIVDESNLYPQYATLHRDIQLVGEYASGLLSYDDCVGGRYYVNQRHLGNLYCGSVICGRVVAAWTDSCGSSGAMLPSTDIGNVVSAAVSLVLLVLMIRIISRVM